MAAATYFDQIQQLYIAYFGRPADPVGQAFWAARIDAEGGSIASVIAGFSVSAESVALFGSSTSAQKVAAIYQNAFGRAPESAGLAYWVALLDSGAVSQAEASWTIQQSAGPGDASVVNNKLIAAKAFTAQIDTAIEVSGYSGANAVATARAYLNKVDATYASIANVATDAVIAVAAATGTATSPVTVVPPSAPGFSAIRDGSGTVSFTSAGTHLSVTELAGVYTFTTDGPTAGSATVLGPLGGINLPATITLSISSVLAASKAFAGAGTVALSDTGTVSASVLNGIDTQATGQVTLAAATALTGSAADLRAALTATGLTLPGTQVVTLTGNSAAQAP